MSRLLPNVRLRVRSTSLDGEIHEQTIGVRSDLVTRVITRHLNGTIDITEEEPGLEYMGEVIGRLQTLPPTCIFEPYVQGVYIEPQSDDRLPPFCHSNVDLTLPAGADGDSGQSCLAILRGGDRIHFPQPYSSLRIYLDISNQPEMRAPEVPNMLPPETAMDQLDAEEQHLLLQTDKAHIDADEGVSGVDAEVVTGASAEVQVKSSAHHANIQQPSDDDETESEDDGEFDLAGLPSTGPRWSNKHDTPPTALTIPETPGHSRPRPNSREGPEMPYSTAPEQSDGDALACTSNEAAVAEAADSPSAGRSQSLRSQRAHGLETQASGAVLVDQADGMDFFEANAHTTTAKAIEASQERPVTEQEADRDEEHALASTKDVVMPLTSDARDEHTIAIESARRSIRGNSRTAGDLQDAVATESILVPQKRRKATVDYVDFNGQETAGPRKLARELFAVTLRSDNVNTDEYEKHSDDDEIQVSHAKRPRVPASMASSSKKRRTAAKQDSPVSSSTLPPRSSGRTKRSVREDTLSTGDEIAVDSPIVETTTRTKRTPKTTKHAKGKASRHTLPLQGETRRSATPASSILTDGDKTPKILLSSTSLSEKQNAAVLNWLRRQHVEIAADVPGKRSHFFCLAAHDRLPTTAKVLRTLALGKLVVSDKWAFMSYAKKELLAPEDFVHDALKGRDASAEGVLKGKTLFFTKALKQEYADGWDNVQTLIREAGPAMTSTGSAFDGNQAAHYGSTILLGSRSNDHDTARLTHEYSHRVYSKDLLTNAILRGELDTESEEFLLTPAKPKKTDSRKRREV